MGKLYDLIQEHIDRQPYGVSERQVAKRLGVTQTTLSNWREPKKLIEKKHLIAISGVTGVPYLRVLDALLDDIGYLNEREDVMGNAEHPAPSEGPAPSPAEQLGTQDDYDLAANNPTDDPLQQDAGEPDEEHTT